MMPVIDKELVVKTNLLSEILTISDKVPEDFYKNTAKYEADLDNAIATAQSLVHEITDEGRKLAKADSAIIRKYAKTTNGFSLSVFRSMTDKVKVWKDEITGKTKLLEQEADNIMSRFEKIENEKLDAVTCLLVDTLAKYRVEIGLRPEFYGDYDLSPMVKLTGSVTEGGKLTAKALGFVKTIANGKLTLQNRHDSRTLILENRCLKAEINPPLTSIHFGAIFNADDEVFNAKVDELINIEVNRRAEMEANITRKNEAANQKRLDDALRDQQAEANRKAKAEHEEHNLVANEVIADIATIRNKELNPARTPDEMRESARRIAESAQYADRNEDMNRELASAAKLRQQADELEKQQQAMVGKKIVTVTVSFKMTVKEQYSLYGVTQSFTKSLKSQIDDKTQSMITMIESSEHVY